MTWLVINMYLCNQHILYGLFFVPNFSIACHQTLAGGIWGETMHKQHYTVMKIIKPTCTNENKETLGPADLIQTNMSCFCINSTQNGSKGQALIKYMT